MASTKSIDSLPDELLVEIFTYLPMEELVTKVQYVSRRWNGLAQDVRLWKDFTFAPPPTYKTKKIITLLSKMPRLKSFTFSEMHDFHPIIGALCEYCREVTKISCYMPDILLEDLKVIGQALPDLESLHIHPAVLYHMMSQENFSCFSKVCQLKCTWASDPYEMYSGLDINVVNVNFKALEHLEILTAAKSSIMEKLIEDNSGSLVHLKVCGVYDKLLSVILKCEKLEELRLDFLSRVCDGLKSSLSSIGKMKDLKLLSLRLFVDSSKDVLCKLFADDNLLSLTELDLNHCMNFSRRVATSIARCCPGLQILRLQACTNLDDSCMEQLARCRELKVLDVSGCVGLTETGIAHIASCRQLHTLNLAGLGGISGLMLESVASSFSLRKLFLDYNEVSENDLINVGCRMPSLVYLSVYHCPELNPAKLQSSLHSVRINTTRHLKTAC